MEPSQPSTIVAGTDNGVYVSHDTGATWTQTLTRHSGLDRRLRRDEPPATPLPGRTAKGSTPASTAGATWTDASSGLGNLDVRSLAFGLDGIAAGTNAGVALSPNGISAGTTAGSTAYSIAAVAVAANFPQFTVIAGADGASSGTLACGYLFSSSGGGAWEVLQSGLPSGAVVSSITAGQIDAAVPKRPLIVATSQGIFRSGDAGVTWTAGTGVPAALTLTVAQFGPLDPNLAYAGADAGGSTGGDFYRSTDGGPDLPQGGHGTSQREQEHRCDRDREHHAARGRRGGQPAHRRQPHLLESDTTAPAPPKLVPESPGALVPSSVPTPMPTATPVPQAVKPTAAPPASGIQRFAQAAFHWPTPLVYEVFFVLLALYVYIRWRQRYYVEGPP